MVPKSLLHLCTAASPGHPAPPGAIPRRKVCFLSVSLRTSERMEQDTASPLCALFTGERFTCSERTSTGLGSRLPEAVGAEVESHGTF